MSLTARESKPCGTVSALGPVHVAPLSADGLRVVGDDRLVFDGHAHHPTIEGPKFYKRDGYYYDYYRYYHSYYTENEGGKRR